MFVRRQEIGGIGIDEGYQRFCGGRQPIEILPAPGPRTLAPHAAAFLREPQTGDVLQQADRLADSAFVGKVPQENLVVDHGCGQFDAHQSPSAQADITPVGSRGAGLLSAGTAMTALAVSWLPGSTTWARKPLSAARRAAERTELRARLGDLAEDVRRQAQGLQQLRGPSTLHRIVELRGAGLRHFVALHARQQPVHEVGHQQDRLGNVQQRRPSQLHRQELIERIDLHELQARVAENLFAGNDGEGLLEHAVGTAVAIVIGIAQQFVVAGSNPKSTPQVSTPTLTIASPPSAAASGRQALPHATPQSRQIPVQSPGEVDGTVFKAVDFVESQSPAVKTSDQMASARRPHVDCQISLFRHLPSLFDRMSSKAEQVRSLLSSRPVRSRQDP